MITIYSVPVATYCAKLRVAMRHKGLKWEELPPPGGYGSAEYKAIVPSGNLPAMVHDGFMLADSEAIAEYLNEAFPDVPMLPDTVQLRAKAREMGRFHDTRLEPAVRAIYPQVAYETRDAATVQALGNAITKHLEALVLLLDNSPLDPQRLWLCDCGFAVTFAWIRAFETDVGVPVTWPQAVLDYDKRLHGFAPVTDELAHYKPAMDAYLEKAKPS
ncbi:glutathione S-transferase family protein [Yoonia sp. 208BN28-4]|uniref:glutathione S-transferase family protein n=1 Tax=Yoonia sp. 208BN28-4 TaxID=3126505 RepID=UPI0030AC3108